MAALVASATGETQPGWRRIADAPELTTSLWLLSHHDVRTNARLRLLRDAFAEAVARKQELIGATCG